MKRFVKQHLTIKYVVFLIVALLVIPRESAAEEWHCWGSPFGHSKPALVKLHQRDDNVSGSVEVFGKTHPARVRVAGLNKTWDFGEKFYYSIVLQPNGRMLYYDSPRGDGANPSAIYYCELLPSYVEKQTKKTEQEGKREEAEKLKLNSFRDAYRMAIMKKIRRNWIRPAGSEKIPNCEVRVLQGPGGIILDVTFGSCPRGTPAYRLSIENAVYKAEPLPKPGDPAIFERNLVLIFTP